MAERINDCIIIRPLLQISSCLLSFSTINNIFWSIFLHFYPEQVFFHQNKCIPYRYAINTVTDKNGAGDGMKTVFGKKIGAVICTIAIVLGTLISPMPVLAEDTSTSSTAPISLDTYLTGYQLSYQDGNDWITVSDSNTAISMFAKLQFKVFFGNISAQNLYNNGGTLYLDLPSLLTLLYPVVQFRIPMAIMPEPLRQKASVSRCRLIKHISRICLKKKVQTSRFKMAAWPSQQRQILKRYAKHTSRTLN